MKKTLFPLVLAALVAGLLLPGVATAQGPGHRFAPAGPGGPGFGPHGGFGVHQIRFLTRYLELSDEQVTSAKALADEFAPRFQALHDGAKGLRDQLETELASADPDPTHVGQLVISLHGKRADGRKLADELKSRFEALLTPDQLRRFQDFEQLRHMRGPGSRAGKTHP